MAIVGRLEELDWFFERFSVLDELKTYLHNAISRENDIYNRICSLDSVCECVYPLNAGMRAIEQAYILKEPQKAFFESHRQFVDFQLVVEGYEYFCIGDKSEFEICTPYDESRDLIVYENTMTNLEPYSLVDSSAHARTQMLLNAGYLAIFMPNDVHAGGLNLCPKAQDSGAQQWVKKSVVKVPVSLICSV